MNICLAELPAVKKEIIRDNRFRDNCFSDNRFRDNRFRDNRDDLDNRVVNTRF